MTTPAAGGQASGEAVDVDELAEVIARGMLDSRLGRPVSDADWSDGGREVWLTDDVRAGVRAVLARLVPRPTGTTDEGAVRRLRAAAAGRREYIRDGMPEDMRRALETEANAFDNAVKVVTGDPWIMRFLLPSWRWDEEEAAAGPVPIAADDEAVERMAIAIYDEGAWCSECSYESWQSCEACREICFGYARAAMGARDLR